MDTQTVPTTEAGTTSRDRLDAVKGITNRLHLEDGLRPLRLAALANEVARWAAAERNDNK